MDDLADYDRHKLALADLLRDILSVLPQDTRKAMDGSFRDLFAGLAEDRFNLVVVGRFSRGKSSLMNAILGMDRLPTGIVPLTSVIAAVAYGSQEKVHLTFEGWSLGRDIPIAELPSYITQQGNPGNVRRVKIAEVRLPSEILRRGFYFVDTPGLGSPVPESTRTTEEFLPEADAFLLVTGYESPLSGDEMRLLRETGPSARRIFVAVNKHDTVLPEERRQALAYVRGQLEYLAGDSAPKVYSVSARDALEAKLVGDRERLKESGVSGLEEELAQFLIEEKRTQFLLRLCDRIEVVIGQVADSGDTAAWLDRLDSLRHAATASQPNHNRAAAASVPAARPIHQIPGCEICRTVDKACFEFLRQYQHQLLVARDVRQSLVDRNGLCPLHTWRYAALSTPRDNCVAYAPVVEGWAEHLRRIGAEARPAGEWAAALDGLLPTQESCVICQICDEAEAKAVADVAGRWAADPQAELSAICVRHLPRLVAAIGDAERVRALLAFQAELFERVTEDMKRYALKFDAVRRYLASEEEDRAAARGLRLMAGLINLGFAQRPD